MLLMLVDHVRETVFLHMQVGDPVEVTAVTPGLFFTETRWFARFKRRRRDLAWLRYF